jgi:hypothetical protein
MFVQLVQHRCWRGLPPVEPSYMDGDSCCCAARVRDKGGLSGEGEARRMITRWKEDSN